MKERLRYTDARDLLLELTAAIGTESVPLARCTGRVLAQPLTAATDIPPFDRSPYDGYALRAADTQTASREAPVALRVVEAIPAGAVPQQSIHSGTAARIMTGAPIPAGADAVVMYEKTAFTEAQVQVFAPVQCGANLVRAGEDVAAGTLLAEAGTAIDAGLIGSLAAQNMREVAVYRRPKIGLLSTGNEVMEVGQAAEAGKIFNANRYTVASVLQGIGCTAEYLGLAADGEAEIAARIADGLCRCDAVLLTGGVSAGDYDLTPAAMERAGVELCVRGVAMKPGMACAYGSKNGKLVCALSGNPAAAVTNLYAVVLPALKKLCGRRDAIPAEITVALAEDFPRKSPYDRLLRGKLDLGDGTARLHLPRGQGNVALSGMIGCDAIAVVPAGSGALQAGTKLKGFLL